MLIRFFLESAANAIGLCRNSEIKDIFYSSLLLAALSCAAFVTACSVPVLEDPQCIEARTRVREFYSFHFGNDMAFTPENIRLREKFLTPRFRAEIASKTGNGDAFTTGTEDIPRAFRVGKCELTSPGKASFEVLVFWYDSNGARQKAITAETEKIGDAWFIDRIIP